MVEKSVITYPKWHDDARRLKDEGRKVTELADYYGVTAGRMYQIITPNWRTYFVAFRDSNRVKDKRSLSFYSKNVDNYTFKPVDEPTPLERERAKNLINRNKKPKPQETPVARAREFDVTRKTVDGKNLLGALIRCSKCDEKAEYFNNSGSITPNYVEKEFTRRGWFVGKNARTDLCPTHAAPIRSPRPEPVEPAEPTAMTVFKHQPKKEETPTMPPVTASISKLDSTPVLPIVPPAVEVKPEPIKVAFAPAPVPPAPAAPVVAKTEAEPVADMDRTTRRIIFSKLNDVYIDETKGYSSDWNDQKVADDLGVALAWVAQVREADFGPETNENIRNVQFDALLKLRDEINRLIVLIDAKIEQSSALDGKVKEALLAMDGSISRANQLKTSIETEDRKMEGFFNRFDESVEEFKKISAQLKPRSS